MGRPTPRHKWCATLPRGAPELRLLQNPGNHGKGYSVRSGMLQALGEMVMFTDADLSAPIEEAEQIVRGDRRGRGCCDRLALAGTGRQTIPAFISPNFRALFQLVTRIVMGFPFADTQCGFKAFNRAAAQTIFRLQTIARWGFDP